MESLEGLWVGCFRHSGGLCFLLELSSLFSSRRELSQRWIIALSRWVLELPDWIFFKKISVLSYLRILCLWCTELSRSGIAFDGALIARNSPQPAPCIPIQHLPERPDGLYLPGTALSSGQCRYTGSSALSVCFSQQQTREFCLSISSCAISRTSLLQSFTGKI